VVAAASFLDLDATLSRLRAEFNAMSATEQALLIDRTAKARTTSRQCAMVMGAGGSFIFLWLLLIGGYAALTANRLKQTAVDRKNADDRFRALLETAPDAMVLVGKDGRMVLVNAQTEKLFGYTRAELLATWLRCWCRSVFATGMRSPADRTLWSPRRCARWLWSGTPRLAQGR